MKHILPQLSPSMLAAILTLAISSLMSSCKKQPEDPGAKNQGEAALSETFVDTISLRRQTFNNQIVCNGRLQAVSRSELSFPRTGIIQRIYVNEGQYVTEGTLIASIDKRERLREVERASYEAERARVTFVDKLIGLGYDADLKNVPADVLRRAEVTSGYYTAKYELQTAQKALEECNLYAPFSGRVANVIAKVHQPSEKVCTLIDDSAFDVEFKVLEAELSHVSVGNPVRVSPFINDSLICKGTIREINPMVDDKGLVRVMARIDGGNKELMDGLNMRVVVDGQSQRLFVVPKDAVVERDGYHVIFLFRDGNAVWTYVDVMHANINSFAIAGCERKGTTLNEGDIVITSGNLNLADGAEVKMSNTH